MDAANQPYTVNEGDGAFYGPKLDFDITDAIGRQWQCATIQLDYQMPERFDLKYIGADNTEHRPVVIHRAIFGSFERFIAILIEHYAGAFPLWLAPVQVRILPIADRHADYARSVRDALAAAGLRVELDERQEKIGFKIREAQLQKIPYMLVTGRSGSGGAHRRRPQPERRRPGSAQRRRIRSGRRWRKLPPRESPRVGRGKLAVSDRDALRDAVCGPRTDPGDTGVQSSVVGGSYRI